MPVWDGFGDCHELGMDWDNSIVKEGVMKMGMEMVMEMVMVFVLAT